MKTPQSILRILTGVMFFCLPLLASVGCSGGRVPDSSTADIESAKYDAEEAKAQKSVGTAVAPD